MTKKVIKCRGCYHPSTKIISDNVLIFIGDDGRIEKITSFDEFIPSDYELINLEDCYILPGLIDVHTHPFIDRDSYQIQHLRDNSAYKTLRALKRVQAMLKAGWTSIRICGDADVGYGVISLKRVISEKIFQGPRIHAAAHYITSTGGGGDILLSEEQCCYIPDGKIVDGVEEMRKAVRKEIKHGSNWIKLLCSGAFMSAHDNPSDLHFTSDEIKTAVDEANMRQVPVCAHAHSIESIRLAVDAGVRSIEHGTFISQDDKLISLLKEKGIWLVPTLYIGDYYIEKGSEDNSQNKMVELSKQVRNIRMDGVNKAYKEGVKIVCGTDNVGWNPSLNCREIMLLHEAGLTVYDAINSATYEAAKLLGIDKELGDIQIGYIADIIAIKGNPFENLKLLETALCFVMLDGQIV